MKILAEPSENKCAVKGGRDAKRSILESKFRIDEYFNEEVTEISR